MKKGYIVVPMLLSLIFTGVVNADEVVDNTNTVVTDVRVETTVSELPQVQPDTTVITTVVEPVREEVKPELPQVQPDTTVSTTVTETTTTTTTQSVTDVVKPELPDVEPDTTVSTTAESTTTTTTTQSSFDDVVVSPDYVVVNTTIAKVDKINYQNNEVVEKTEEMTTTKEGEMKVLPNTGTEHSSFAWLGLLPFLSGAYLIKKNQKKEVE